jgi:hypothetical protein
MRREVRQEIIKMLIPVIGTWWVIKRILPDLGDITWWDTDDKAIPTILILALYQAICWVSWKVAYMMYFFGYTFEQVFTQW